MPASSLPAALKIASKATNINPILIVLLDCMATIFVKCPIIINPAVAAQAYSNYNI